MTDRIQITRVADGLWTVEAWGGYDGYVKHENVMTTELPVYLAELSQYDGESWPRST